MESVRHAGLFPRFIEKILYLDVIVYCQAFLMLIVSLVFVSSRAMNAHSSRQNCQTIGVDCPSTLLANPIRIFDCSRQQAFDACSSFFELPYYCLVKLPLRDRRSTFAKPAIGLFFEGSLQDDNLSPQILQFAL
jgi:hypothetical protein